MANPRAIRQILTLTVSCLAMVLLLALAGIAPAAARSHPVAFVACGAAHSAVSATRRADADGQIRYAALRFIAGQPAYERLNGGTLPNSPPDETVNPRLPEHFLRSATVLIDRPVRPVHLQRPRMGAVPSSPRDPPSLS